MPNHHRSTWERAAAAGALVVLTAMLAAGAAGGGRGRQHQHGRRTQIPQIAHIAGVIVGQTTVEDLERRWGPGLVITGGHPRGARVWRLRGWGWLIHVDGFNFRRAKNGWGEIVDVAEIADQRRWERCLLPSLPWAPASGMRSGYWSAFPLGMRRASVVRRLGQRGIRCKSEPGCLVVRAGGFAPAEINADGVRQWEAHLKFTEERLASISVQAD